MPSIVFSTAKKPGIPQSFNAAAEADGDILLTYTAPADDGGSPVTEYVGEYQIDGGGSWIEVTSVGAALSITISGLTAGSNYFFRVRARNIIGDSDVTSVDSATPIARPGQMDPPDLVVNSSTQISVSRADPPATFGTPITSYDRRHSLDETNWTTVTGVASLSTITGLSAGDLVYVQNRAVASGASPSAGDWSASATETTFAAPDQMAAPSLVVDSDTQITATLAADPPTNGTPITSYDLRYSTDEATWTELTGITSPRAITGLTGSTLYYVQSRAVASDASPAQGAWSASATATTDVSPTVPDAFVDANWSVATGFGASELDITIASLPSDGGAAITDVEYDIDGGNSWTSLGATSGTTTITMAAASTSYAIRLRAVNSVGAGAAGNSESATSGATPTTVPDAFVDANWSVATGSGANELDITIASLPSDGGSAITDIEYDIDASNTWISLSTTTTGTTTVSMAAASTSYAIRLRAVNGVGNAAAGNSESATSGAAGGAGGITATTGSPTITGSVSYDGKTGTVYDWTGNGSFTAEASTEIYYLVVAGGGGGTSDNQRGGGGGAGGMVGGGTSDKFTSAAETYTVTVGAGGAAGDPGSAGSNSSITGTSAPTAAIGGGAGGDRAAGGSGGSGGGGGGAFYAGGAGTAGQGW